ncbi:MAG: SAM-dependent methyltransferase, partial [Lachnospiraceae bacterium]|nr:SAM-dependent methyltransferase [Lachnospiraceae bacterium]
NGRIYDKKQAKFRQINRFLELIADVLPVLPEKRIRILDLCCGKSYLSFAVYHYFANILQYEVSMTGVDLKADVIAYCNEVAEDLGFGGLEFLCGDVGAYETEDKPHLVISLHACDTATDYALYKALCWGASVVLSVPCCQHEWNRQTECEPLQPFLKYGIIKERMSALMTDAFRANVMEACGYKTQLLEFIDMEHTPKNILLRAVKKEKIARERMGECVERGVKEILSYCGTEPTLYRLLTEKE